MILSQTEFSLDVFTKPPSPQKSFATHKNNTLHNLIEFTNEDEHDSNLKCDVTSVIDNDGFGIMFTND